MSLFAKIRTGEVQREAFVSQLENYRKDRVVLQRNAQRFGPELFQSKLKEIEMSISFCEIFLQNYEKIAQGPTQRHRLVK